MSTTFADLGVPSDLVRALATRGVVEPFDIQAATIPDALAGRDVCGRAPTGSGKTIAFGVPLAARVGNARPHRPRALVLAPTRELAEQIQRELKPLVALQNRRVAAVYGGVGYGPQRTALRKGVDVLVACPGRLADLVGQGDVHLGDVDLVVIDEADRMADMGFLPEVKRLLDATSPKRQTLLFSATLDGDVAVLTERYQQRPVRHEVGSVEPDITSARHLFWRVETTERMAHTADALTDLGSTVVFCRTRRGADRLARQLTAKGIAAEAIHGGRSQAQRNRALQAFTNGKVQALVATDVAARGIHVDGVAGVIHYDPPEDAKTYLHRSGRTARAGASGVVVSFVTGDQVRDANRMLRELGLETHIEAPGAAGVTGGPGVRPTPAGPSRDHAPRQDARRRPEGSARSGQPRGRTTGGHGRGAGGHGRPARRRRRKPSGQR
ncbi:MAG TPA: DEAD/DEAH box helicase [Acidimicrobiia bacterium]|nr:DEAD/DEAH box helicase [Acidimicrobiia bacterium]